MNDEGAAHAKFVERAGEKFGEIRGRNADDLRGSARGIGERAEKIEYRAHAQFAARVTGMFHRGVDRGSEQETDPHFIDRAANAFGGLIERDAELFEYIGGAAARA